MCYQCLKHIKNYSFNHSKHLVKLGLVKLIVPRRQYSFNIGSAFTEGVPEGIPFDHKPSPYDSSTWKAKHPFAHRAVAICYFPLKNIIFWWVMVLHQRCQDFQQGRGETAEEGACFSFRQGDRMGFAEGVPEVCFDVCQRGDPV